MPLSSDDRGTANRVLLGLPGSVFERLKPNMDMVTLFRGEHLYHADDALNHVYFVERGLISLVKTMIDGRSVEVAVVGIEGMAGAFGLAGPQRALFDAVVQIPGHALRIDNDTLRSEIDENFEARTFFGYYFQCFVSQIAQISACNSLHSLRARFCRWVLIAHDSAGSDSFQITQEFLAAMLGVQRAGVSIAANLLQQAGFIRYTRGRVTIADRPGLEAAACECYGAIRSRYDQLLDVATGR